MKTKTHLKVRKDDLVEVITGTDAGTRGRVLAVLDDETLLIEGVNNRWKHLRRSQQHPQGGRVEKEAPIHASNVMVVSEETGTKQRVRIEMFRGETKSGKQRTFRYRVGTKDGQPISSSDKELAEKHALAEKHKAQKG